MLTQIFRIKKEIVTLLLLQAVNLAYADLQMANLWYLMWKTVKRFFQKIPDIHQFLL